MKVSVPKYEMVLDFMNNYSNLTVLISVIIFALIFAVNMLFTQKLLNSKVSRQTSSFK